ncbi:MAG: RNA 2',3'-cyclic phosphodiesterase [Deltaproteobacteria bacterium]|nr:RNA 2',3'-cyclic phosphodiesterase [Deltaproteobacteria bacterium]
MSTAAKEISPPAEKDSVRTLRAFVGVPVGAAVVRAWTTVRPGFEGGSVRWVPEENLHLTLKFLGDIEETRVAAIGSALREALSDTEGFVATARGLGVFPDAARPRVLWIGLDAPALTALACGVDRALAPFGVAPSATPFRPHVTVGRWRHPAPRDPRLRQALARWRDHEFGHVPVGEVTLFRSTLRPGGAIYSPLGIFPLKPGGNGSAGANSRTPH